MSLISNITLMGSAMSPSLRNAVTKCSINASMGTIAQLEIQFTDPNWKLLGSGLVAMSQRVELGGFILEISAISTGDNNGTENFTIKCRPWAFRQLKAQQGSRVVNNVSPSEFVAMECQSAGVNYVVQPSTRRPQISRDILQNGQKPDLVNPPSSWSTFQRLANEVGFAMFESQNTVYFAQPSWLLSSGLLAPFNLGYRTGTGQQAVTVPQGNKTLDDPQITMSVSAIVSTLDDVRPGKALVLSGAPAFDGNYLISGFSADLLRTPNVVQINGATPKDPTPPPTAGATGSQITGPWYDESAL